MNKAQAAQDIAKGERDLLAGRADGLVQATKDVHEQLDSLVEHRTTKVWSLNLFCTLALRRAGIRAGRIDDGNGRLSTQFKGSRI